MKSYSTEIINDMKKNCDGICELCQAVSYGLADPNEENGYCRECENKTLLGVNVALKKNLIAIYHGSIKP